MRVLFVIDSLGAGGAERSTAELVRDLADRGHHVAVVCFHRSDEGVQEEVRSAGVTVHFLRSSNRAGRVRQLRSLIREEHPDIVHSSLVEADLVTRVAAIALPVVVLTSLVNTTYSPMRLRDSNINPGKLAVVRSADSWTGRHLTDHFHAVSETVKRSAVDTMRLDPDRITVVERGRDPRWIGEPSPERRAAARRMLGLSDADEVIVTVGRQEFQKGQRFLVEAVGRLVGHRPALRCVVVGREGHASQELDHLTRRLGLAERVDFLGHREDVPEILAAADLFAFPSMYEGLPGALIEAMALGVPIVASDLAAIREVVEAGRNAVLVRPGEPAALARAISGLLDDPEAARRFSARGREIFRERFTAERSNRRMLELYGSLLDRADRR